MKAILVVGIILIIAGVIQSPATFNGLDTIGWALALAAGVTLARRARRTS